MPQAPEPVIRGRCECGRRYRIRNAMPGVTVACPKCERPITVTTADLRAALTSELGLIPLQAPTEQILEAVLIDHGDLALAPQGSRSGLTGRRDYQNEEALLMSAMRGWVLTEEAHGRAGRPAARNKAGTSPARRTFAHDLLASLWFAGVTSNGLNILLTAVACSLFTISSVLPGILGLVLWPLAGIVLVYIMQFYWSVLRETSAGEDEIPWVAADWSLWEDGVLPLIYILVINLACSLPYFILHTVFHGSEPAWAAWLALMVGWLAWPVCVMAAAMDGLAVLLRVDWLMQSALLMGPAYLLAWAAAVACFGGWIGVGYMEMLLGKVAARFSSNGLALLAYATTVGVLTKVTLTAVNLYCGYVLFRTVGLLYRHHAGRFPWEK